MGIGTGIEWVNASSWTFRGEELPYAYASASGLRAVWDSLWPSAEACAEMTARLDAHVFAYPHKQLTYRCASHLLLPFETDYARCFRVGRQFPKECKATVHELRREVQEFMRDAGKTP